MRARNSRPRFYLPFGALVASSLVAAFAVQGSACSENIPTGESPEDGATGVDAGAADGAVDDATTGDGGAMDGFDAGPPPVVDNGGRTCTGVTATTAADAPVDSAVPPSFVVPAGFVIETIAKVPGARNLAALPNGDLLAGTSGDSVYLVPHADADVAGAPAPFVTIADSPVHGVTFHQASCNVFVGTQHGVYRLAYQDAQATGTAGEPIARVRPKNEGGHITTSVQVARNWLYVGVGSSCNACTETDPTRATVQRMLIDGSSASTYATRIRNPIAMTENPVTGTLWAGNAGQDGLPTGHPYELFDSVTTHAPIADYGWPDCEENNHAYKEGADCSRTVAPKVVLPAYSTLTAASFYPSNPPASATRAFPAAYRGGAFVVARGSWHETEQGYFSPPRVVYVPMNGDAPQKAVDWKNPDSGQWTNFLTGFELADRKTRVGRPAGIAVGPSGALFVADDQAGAIYRIRPGT